MALKTWDLRPSICFILNKLRLICLSNDVLLSTVCRMLMVGEGEIKAIDFICVEFQQTNFLISVASGNTCR